MSAAARNLARHIERLIQIQPDLAYLIGPGSRTWEMLCDAIASIAGETSQSVSDRLVRNLPVPSVIPIGRDALKLLEHFVDQEPCEHDHHGYCQTHSLESPCSVENARQLIARWKGDLEERGPRT